MSSVDDVELTNHLEDALRPLIQANEKLTPLQYLHQLKCQVAFLAVDAVRDGAVVQKLVRKIKGPMKDEPLEDGCLQKVRELQNHMQPGFVGMSSTLGGGPSGGLSSRQHQEGPKSGIEDWPFFFLDPNADIYGDNLRFMTKDNADDCQSCGEGASSTSCNTQKSKKLTQKERRQNKKKGSNASAMPGKGGDGETKSPQHRQHRCLFDEVYVWLIDAYRMRCHDDMQWRGGIHRGIYEIDHRFERRLECSNDDKPARLVLVRKSLEGFPDAHPTPLSVCKDFFLFLKLVAMREMYPPCFNFSTLLKFARKLLPKRFQKDHARYKYGDENALASDRPSLRRTAEVVYRLSIQKMRKHIFCEADCGAAWKYTPHEYTDEFQYDGEIVTLWTDIEKWFEVGIMNHDRFSLSALSSSSTSSSSAQGAHSNSSCSSSMPSPGPASIERVANLLSPEQKHKVALLFADVGGIEIWRKLYDSLDLVGDNFGMAHALQIDRFVPSGSTVKMKNLTGINRLNTGSRPIDYNGALGTFVELVPPSAPNQEQRYKVAANDGSTLSLKASSVEVHIQKTGHMSMYAQMHLRNHNTSMLNIDMDESESSDDDTLVNDVGGRFMRKRGLQNIGEARKCEESASRLASDRLYTFEQCEEDIGGQVSRKNCNVKKETVTGNIDEYEGAVVVLHKLEKLEDRLKYGGRRARITHFHPEDKEVDLVLLPKFQEDTSKRGRFLEKEMLSRVKIPELKFLDGRDDDDISKSEEDTSCGDVELDDDLKKTRVAVVPVSPRRFAPGPPVVVPHDLEQENVSAETGASSGLSSAKKPLVPALDAKQTQQLTDLIVQCLTQKMSGKAGGVELSPKALEAALRQKNKSLVALAQKATEAHCSQDLSQFDMKPKKGKKSASSKSGSTSEQHWLVSFFKNHLLNAPDSKDSSQQLPFRYQAFRKVFVAQEEEGDDEGHDESDAASQEEAEGQQETGDNAEQDVDETAPLSQLTSSVSHNSLIFDPTTTTEDEVSDSGSSVGSARGSVGRNFEVAMASQAKKLLPVNEKERLLAPAVTLSDAINGDQKAQAQEESKEIRVKSSVLDAEEQQDTTTMATKGNDSIPRVPRYYVVGSQFFLSPQDLFFTQDTIKESFKNRQHETGKSVTIRDTLSLLLDKKMRKRDIEIMNVVYHDGFFYSCCNRRLAMYMLLFLCGRCWRLKVEMMDKEDRAANWRKRFTTECNGDWIRIRETGEIIHRTVQGTTFQHPMIQG